MPKITNDGLIRSGTGCFIAVPIITIGGVKGLESDTKRNTAITAVITAVTGTKFATFFTIYSN